MSLIDIDLACFDCKKCGLHTCRKYPATFTGNYKSKVTLIGEAAGFEEQDCGVPFVGKSGELTTRALSSAGIDRRYLYITNVIKCWPNNNGINRKPTDEEINTCKQYLFDEMKIINPILYILIGGVACSTILNTDRRISELNGKILNGENEFDNVNDFIKSYKSGPIFMPYFHPSYIIRKNSKIAEQQYINSYNNISSVVKLIGVRVSVSDHS